MLFAWDYKKDINNIFNEYNFISIIVKLLSWNDKNAEIFINE